MKDLILESSASVDTHLDIEGARDDHLYLTIKYGKQSLCICLDREPLLELRDYLMDYLVEAPQRQRPAIISYSASMGWVWAPANNDEAYSASFKTEEKGREAAKAEGFLPY